MSYLTLNLRIASGIQERWEGVKRVALTFPSPCGLAIRYIPPAIRPWNFRWRNFRMIPTYDSWIAGFVLGSSPYEFSFSDRDSFHNLGDQLRGISGSSW